jgi:hypothetical protein
LVILKKTKNNYKFTNHKIQTKMKQITKFFALAFVMIAFSASLFAQTNVATATATATIVTPVTITNNGDLNFGNVVASVGGGTVTITPAGARSAVGVTLPAVPGTVTPAHFNVTGTANFTYTIAITGTPVTVTSGANTMTVNAFTSTPVAGVGTGLLDGTGAQTIDVGATLVVGANQPAGTYVSGTPFTVTVNYN